MMYEWLRARPFAEWLVREAGENAVAQARVFDPAFSRRLHAWLHSIDRSTVNVYTADEVITRCFPDVDFRMIPEDIYCERSARRGNGHYTERKRRQAVALIEAGWSPTEVSHELGCSIDAVHTWRKAACEKAVA